LHAVRREAGQGAKEILSDEVLTGNVHPDQAFIVKKEAGQIVLTLNFKGAGKSANRIGISNVSTL
jgi:hypothetical protein